MESRIDAYLAAPAVSVTATPVADARTPGERGPPRRLGRQ
jgi:hypothetical protein